MESLACPTKDDVAYFNEHGDCEHAWDELPGVPRIHRSHTAWWRSLIPSLRLRASWLAVVLLPLLLEGSASELARVGGMTYLSQGKVSHLSQREYAVAKVGREPSDVASQEVAAALVG